jgi:hypothetical protein
MDSGDEVLGTATIVPSGLRQPAQTACHYRLREIRYRGGETASGGCGGSPSIGLLPVG